MILWSPVAMRLLSVLILLQAGACGRIGYDASGEADVIDATPPADDGALAFTPSNGASDVHLVGVSSNIVVAGVTTFNTDNGQIIKDGLEFRPAGTGVINGIRFNIIAGNIGLFAMTDLHVPATTVLRGVGDPSMIIFSAGDVTVGGLVDVSGGLCADLVVELGCNGPGGGVGAQSGNPAGGCAAGGDGVVDGDTGGGGGALGLDGAAGGEEIDELMAPGGIGGVVAGSSCPGSTLVPLLGGSGGGAGGDNTGSSGAGGGGAIQITSLSAILLSDGGIDGGINAGGSGGDGAGNNGGGGGGSGGAILLEAPVIDLGFAILAANGGGGGAGNDSSDGTPGLLSDQPAPGGSGGRDGGAGGAGTTPPTQGGAGNNDTGGGGGGVGIIRLNGGSVETGAALISPAPTTGTLN